MVKRSEMMRRCVQGHVGMDFKTIVRGKVEDLNPRDLAEDGWIGGKMAALCGKYVYWHNGHSLGLRLSVTVDITVTWMRWSRKTLPMGLRPTQIDE